jgi:hypothetical protein
MTAALLARRSPDDALRAFSMLLALGKARWFVLLGAGGSLPRQLLTSLSAPTTVMEATAVLDNALRAFFMLLTLGKARGSCFGGWQLTDNAFCPNSWVEVTATLAGLRTARLPCFWHSLKVLGCLLSGWQLLDWAFCPRQLLPTCAGEVCTSCTLCWCLQLQWQLQAQVAQIRPRQQPASLCGSQCVAANVYGSYTARA